MEILYDITAYTACAIMGAFVVCMIYAAATESRNDATTETAEQFARRMHLTCDNRCREIRGCNQCDR